MRKIAVLVMAVLLAGCSAKQVNLNVISKPLYTTPSPAKAELILSREFQSKVYSSKPSYGNAWSLYTFDIHAGGPFSQALIAHLRAKYPSLRVGDVADGNPSDIQVTPSDITIEFGLDDGSAVLATGLFPLAGFAMNTVAGAKAHVTASVRANGVTREVKVLGAGAVPSAYLTISEQKLYDAIAASLDDAASRLASEVNQIATTKP